MLAAIDAFGATESRRKPSRYGWLGDGHVLRFFPAVEAIRWTLNCWAERFGSARKPCAFGIQILFRRWRTALDRECVNQRSLEAEIRTGLACVKRRQLIEGSRHDRRFLCFFFALLTRSCPGARQTRGGQWSTFQMVQHGTGPPARWPAIFGRDQLPELREKRRQTRHHPAIKALF